MLILDLDLYYMWHFSPELPRGIVGHGIRDAMPMQLLPERPAGGSNAFGIEGAKFKCVPGGQVDSARVAIVHSSVHCGVQRPAHTSDLRRSQITTGMINVPLGRGCA